MFKYGSTSGRYDRLVEMVAAGGSAGGRFTLDDFRRMQHDAHSSSGAALVSLFQEWSSEDADIEWGRAQIAGWDGAFDKNSTAAALYMIWRGEVDDELLEAWQGDGAALPATGPRGAETSAPEAQEAQQQAAIEAGLGSALASLEERLGADRTEWRWGRLNTQSFRHALLSAFDLPTVEKTGGAGTVYANGATFREVFDLADWDAAMATTAPGQSGQPGSPFYGDQIEPWAAGEYFPLRFSRAAVEEVTAHRLVLRPAGR